MGIREELLRDALEEFVDRLPDEITNTESAWIIFNILGSREKLEDWGSIHKLTVANIAEYFIHQAFSNEELAETEAKMFLEKIVKEHKSR